MVCPQIFLHATAAARHSLLGFAKKLKRGREPIDIVRVVEGDLKMSGLVYYHHHGGEEVSERYLEGWTQAIGDARKKACEGRR